MAKWGIWGFGAVGKSVLSFLADKGYQLAVYDNRELTLEEKALLERYQATPYAPDQVVSFIAEQDFIVPSPGIPPDTIPSSKLISELDLFCSTVAKPYIGVTGSLGKTTLVSVMHQIMNHNGLFCLAGGNIGRPMLELLQENGAERLLLELSSFQLEKSNLCKASFALLTNLFENHLDRHRTFEAYVDAKYRLLCNQDATDKALVPISIASLLRKRTARPLIFFNDRFDTYSYKELAVHDMLYELVDNELHIHTKTSSGLQRETIIISKESMQRLALLLKPTQLQVLTLSHQLGIYISSEDLIPSSLYFSDHRIQCVGTYKGRICYNDSKATIMEATIAATVRIKEPTHLILGGLSKGVDRLPYLTKMSKNVLSVHCFGKEAPSLHSACKKLGFKSFEYVSLDEAFAGAVKNSQEQEAILLSPGGSSYDLYNNYEERGKHFKRLVKDSC